MESCDGSGNCVGSGDPCTQTLGDCSETCNEAADNCNGNDPAGSACSDGLFCTSNDQCNGSGICVGGPDPCPGIDGDADCSEHCNETANNCSTNDPVGAICDSCPPGTSGSGTCDGFGTCFSVCF